MTKERESKAFACLTWKEKDRKVKGKQNNKDIRNFLKRDIDILHSNECEEESIYYSKLLHILTFTAAFLNILPEILYISTNLSQYFIKLPSGKAS